MFRAVPDAPARFVRFDGVGHQHRYFTKDDVGNVSGPRRTTSTVQMSAALLRFERCCYQLYQLQGLYGCHQHNP